MKLFSVFNSFVFSRKFLSVFATLFTFFFLNFYVYSVDVYYRWTPYTDSTGSKTWDGVWSATNNDNVNREETSFWSYWKSDGEWEKTYAWGYNPADYPGLLDWKPSYTYFTGENAVTATLTADLPYSLEVLYIGDCKGYNNTASSAAVGSELVTINLAGSSLKTEKLVLGNSYFGKNDFVKFAVTGGGTLAVSDTMSFAAGCTYNIEIRADTVLEVSALSADVSGAKINFFGKGTLRLGNATFSAGEINFTVKNVEVSGATKISESATVNFENVSRAVFSGKLENSATVNFSDCPALGFDGGFTNSGTVEFSGATASTVSGKITNSGDFSVNESSEVIFKADFTNSLGGTLQVAGSAKMTFSSGFTNSATANFKDCSSGTLNFNGTFKNNAAAKVTLPEFSGASVIFGDFVAYSNSGTVYSAGVCTVSFATSVTDDGTWIYSGGTTTAGTVTNENISYNILELNGKIVIPGNLTAKKIIIETEKLNIQGVITSDSISINTEKSIVLDADATMSAASISLFKDTTFNTNGKNLTFGSENDGSSITSDSKNNLVISDSSATSAGKAVFYSSLGTETKPLGKISSEAEISFNADVYADSIEAKNAALISSAKITTTNGQTYDSAVTITGTTGLQAKFVSENGGILFGGAVDISVQTAISADGEVTFSGTLTTLPSGPLSVVASTVTFKGVVSGASSFDLSAKSVQFDSDFVVSGEVSLLSDVYFSGTAKDEIKVEAEKIVVGSENLEKNLYISVVDVDSAKNVEWNAPLEISGSLLLLNGNLTLGKNPSDDSSDISALKDIVLLNGNSSSMYDDTVSAQFNWRSGAKNIFKYQGNVEFPAKFPDGTEISSENFYSSLNGLDGIAISAGENFYCNGINLEGDSEWSLKAGDNENSENFAVAYNSSIKNCSYSSSGSGISYFAAAESTDGGGNNENVCFGHPEISFARTVYDDVVEVSFKDSISGNSVKIENSNNEIWTTFAGSEKFLTYENDGEKISFAGTYIDAESTETTENQGDLEKFYLKAPETWNTDATGKSSGAAQSTDMNGNHRSSIPYLNLVRAISDDFSGLLDEHKNRVANYDGEEKRFVDVTDSCSPVLIAVRTGQELHTESPENQTTYDSHNFLEFQYSEEISVDEKDSSVLNVQTSETFGGMENNSSGVGFVVTGLVQFEKGKISLGSESGIAAEKLNSLYRNFAVSSSKGASPQTHRFRISLAGYQSQSAAENSSGFPYWPGYIDSENTEIPSGKIVRLSTGGENTENASDSNFNDLIKDSEGNSLLVKSQKNHELQTLSVISTSSEDSLETDWTDSLYGSWDLSAPVFAAYYPLLAEKKSSFYEILGACKASDTVLERVEFHVFDNSDDFSENLGAEWYSQFGWGNSKSTLFSEDSYGSDIFGGSRPFGEYEGAASTKTSGGIRYSTLYNKSSYFKYGIDSESSTESFKDSTIKSGASSSLFLPQVGSKREISSNDSLYFSIFLNDGTNLPLKTNFSIKYDEKACVTDLAGNLMRTVQVESVDRVSPRFNMTSAKISGNKLYVVFNKELNLDAVGLKSSDGTVEYFDIADSLRFIKIPEDSHKFNEAEDVVSDLYIETGVPPQKTYSSSTFTGLVFTLNRNVTLEDVKNYYIQCYSPGSGQFDDPFTGISNVKVTSVTDINGNYMEHGEAHALSDFAVNAVNPVYAYDDRFLEENFGFSESDAALSNLSVHDWNEEQQNDGTLMVERDIFVVTSQDSGISDSEDDLPQKIIMYYANTPDSDSVSSEYNKNLEESLRVWIPSFIPYGDDSGSSGENVSPVSALASSVNASNLFVYGEIDKSIAKFVLNWETLNKNGYSSGNQISFLFSLADSDGIPIKICHAPSYDEISGVYKIEKNPLFALRLKSSEDATSLDLWSFKLKNTTLQRGNVTVFNNVIDVNKGEMSVVQVNMPSEGKLDVIVMTLDGNVIRYLQHGTASAGEHSYSWNGTTKSGKKVARGLYFVRVFGNGIDETRKIMVVKN